jgi:hypothetical protein
MFNIICGFGYRSFLSEIRMRRKDQRYCLKMMEKLMGRPCSAAFLGPPSSNENEVDRSRPTFYLTDVQAKLLAGEYGSISDFSGWMTSTRFGRPPAAPTARNPI